MPNPSIPTLEDFEKTSGKEQRRILRKPFGFDNHFYPSRFATQKGHADLILCASADIKDPELMNVAIKYSCTIGNQKEDLAYHAGGIFVWITPEDGNELYMARPIHMSLQDIVKDALRIAIGRTATLDEFYIFWQLMFKRSGMLPRYLSTRVGGPALLNDKNLHDSMVGPRFTCQEDIKQVTNLWRGNDYLGYPGSEYLTTTPKSEGDV